MQIFLRAALDCGVPVHIGGSSDFDHELNRDAERQVRLVAAGAANLGLRLRH